MKNIIETCISKIKREDIINFANKNNLNVSEDEINFVYSFIKNEGVSVLNNPNSFDITLYKNKFSNENYLFLKEYIDKYKNII